MYIGAYLWPRRSDRAERSIIEILREPECFVSVGIHIQGESVALTPDGTSYYTHSEKVNQPILKFNILEQ